MISILLMDTEQAYRAEQPVSWSRSDSSSEEQAAFFENHSQNTAARGAERQPDTDLPVSLLNSIGDHSVQSGCREKKRRGGKGTD